MTPRKPVLITRSSTVGCGAIEHQPLSPDDTLPPRTSAAVCAAYGLGDPVDAAFVARGAMGAVNRITTRLDGRTREWTVKRSYWSHYTEQDIGREVAFTERCRVAGVPGPRSVQRVDNGRFVLHVDDQPTAPTQYRVLEWLPGDLGRRDDPATIAAMGGWLAVIHRLAVATGGQPVDPWFAQVEHDWAELAARLAATEPDLAELIGARHADLAELTRLVNDAPRGEAVWCHTDVGVSNVIWGSDGPVLIDWENSGPLVPRQEVGAVARSHGDRGVELYAAYRRADGPAVFNEPADLATSVAIHLNYLAGQSDLLLDPDHPEQREFARDAATNAARTVPTPAELDRWIADLRAVG